MQRNYILINTIGPSVGMAGSLLIFIFLRHHLNTLSVLATSVALLTVSFQSIKAALMDPAKRLRSK